jgi:hypothetical protein
MRALFEAPRTADDLEEEAHLSPTACDVPKVSAGGPPIPVFCRVEVEEPASGLLVTQAPAWRRMMACVVEGLGTPVRRSVVPLAIVALTSPLMVLGLRTGGFQNGAGNISEFWLAAIRGEFVCPLAQVTPHCRVAEEEPKR